MRTIKIIGTIFITFLFLFSTDNSFSSNDIVIENDLIRFVISQEGLSKSLLEKKTGRELLINNSTPFAVIKKQGISIPASNVVKKGKIFHVDFGASSIYGDFSIFNSNNCIVIKLVNIYGESIDEICIAQLNVLSLKNNGPLVSARWDEKLTISFMGLSDKVDTRLVNDNIISASVYPEFGTEGEGVAIIVEKTPEFLKTVRAVEGIFNLPSPTLNGQWAKFSSDVNESYMFTDLTEANVDETIQYAKRGKFTYILIYSGTWATSNGSYPINTANFPRNEGSLKGVIDKCHSAGLKVGMHILTSFVGKNDPLARQMSALGLLKDAESTLAEDLDEQDKEIVADSILNDFSNEPAYYGSAKAGTDILIEDEIIHYTGISNQKSNVFKQCTRGYSGTTARPHKAGSKIYHLAERFQSYLADLKSPLMGKISERVAGVFNRCGFDMIYFDGGEVNNANGPAWYWVGQQQVDILLRIKRDVLVQGSGITPWTWHFITRGASDDFASVGTKQFLDYYKIAYARENIIKNFLPSELGWWGFLDYTPHHPATTPDEVEHYASRMLALDTPVSLETNIKALKTNGRTFEMLKLLGEYEQLRLRRAIPTAVKERLRTDEWHLKLKEGKPEFRQIKYDTKRLDTQKEIRIHNGFGPQAFKFRLQAVPYLASVGSKDNVKLAHFTAPLVLKPVSEKKTTPGKLAERIIFSQVTSEQPGVFMVGPGGNPKAIEQRGKALDLINHRALAVHIRVDNPPPKTGEPCAVLNVQLEAGDKTYRDHYIDLDFTGERIIIIEEPNTERMLPEFRPLHENYAFKAAMYTFNYKNITALNFRWMRQSSSEPTGCSITSVEALLEKESVLKNPEISVGGSKFTLPVSLNDGDYAEYWGEGPIRVFNRNGVLQANIESFHGVPELPSGENKIRLDCGNAAAKLTVITLGNSINI